jgi:hypothetical protein
MEAAAHHASDDVTFIHYLLPNEQISGVKRNLKRPETSTVLCEMRGLIPSRSRFMVFERSVIGKMLLKRLLVSRFLPIHLKCEMRGRFLK